MLLPDLQSAYRAHRSTETAFVKVLADILKVLDSSDLTMLTLLDLSVLMAIFPGEPGLAGFIEAKDDGSGGDIRSYKTCKAQLNHHHQQTNTQFFLPAGCLL